MIYISADDYGLCGKSDAHIQKCIDEGVINKVSVFPNFSKINLSEISKNKDVRLSLHLNLVEGRCMADVRKPNLLSDKDGNFIHTFGGLFRLSLIHRKKFEEEVCEEIRAQIRFWKRALPEGAAFCIDSHQHVHMIPTVFKALVRALEYEGIKPEYIRIPWESPMPFIKTPSLYHTYSLKNVIKQWLLNFLWLKNKPLAKKHSISQSYFMGILFSGHMDKKRVSRVLPKFVQMAKKNGKDIEVLFHPGYLEKAEPDFKDKNIAFEKFYISKNRKTEFDSVMNICEGSVL